MFRSGAVVVVLLFVTVKTTGSSPLPTDRVYPRDRGSFDAQIHGCRRGSAPGYGDKTHDADDYDYEHWHYDFSHMFPPTVALWSCGQNITGANAYCIQCTTWVDARAGTYMYAWEGHRLEGPTRTWNRSVEA